MGVFELAAAQTRNTDAVDLHELDKQHLLKQKTYISSGIYCDTINFWQKLLKNTSIIPKERITGLVLNNWM